MTIYTPPSVTFEASAKGPSPGLVGAMGVRIRNPTTGTDVLARTTAGISEQPAGSALYFVSLAAPATLGAYAVIWDDGAGEFAGEDLEVTFSEPPAALPAPSGAGLSGLCSLWCEIEDLPCAQGSGSEDVAKLTAATLMASEILYALSARQFAGACSTIVRPCRQTCDCFGDARLSGDWYWGGWSWRSGDSACGCGCDDRVLLSGYPVTRIATIRVDGVAIDPANYELLSYRYVQALSGQRWPACQDLGSPLGAPGTWSIEYDYGSAPPESGRQAAIELACQFFLAMTDPGACRLPTGVTKLTRQGITMERLLPMFGKDARTGLVLTDAFLAAYNPSGLRRRPTVRSPGYPRYGRRTTAP